MSDAPMSAEEVANRRFTTTFRGLDPEEVHSYLARVAEELRSLHRREEEWQERLADAEHRAAHPQWDEVAVSQAIGEQTSRILSSAQTVAQELKAKAEENAARILRDGHAEAQRIRERAESVLVERTEEAEAEATRIRQAAQAEADSLLEHSRRESESTLAQAAARATSLVEEAQTNQQRILGELGRRRRIAHAQVEQLRAGRERLLEAYRVVRSTLDEVVAELQRAEPEARLAAEAAVRRLGPDPGVIDRPTDDRPAVEDEPEKGEEVLRGELKVVRPPSEIEVVRILGSETNAGHESQGPAPRTVVEPARPDSVTEAEVAPEPEQLPEPEEAREPEVAPEPEEPAEPEAAPEPEVAPEPEEAREPEEGREPEEPPVQDTDSQEVSTRPVDELFARIRADRATAVARAHEVLGTDASRQKVPDGQPRPADRSSMTALAGDDIGEAPLTEEEMAELHRRDGALEPITSSLARRIKRVLQDEQNEVLDRLRSAQSSSRRHGPLEILPPGDDQTVRFAGVGEEPLRQAAAVGGQFFRGSTGEPPDVTDLALGLAESLAGPLRRQLEEGLAGAAEDEPAALVQRIGAAYRECKVRRVDELAADAVIAAFSRGILARAPASQLRWVVRDEAGPCPDCDDNALAGPTPGGEAYPTGQQHPPAHGGCRCLLVPAT